MGTLNMFEIHEEVVDDLFTMHTRRCANCGATFQTCGKGRRCSACLLIPLNAPAIEDGTTITCRVCDQIAKVPLSNDALICPECRRDVAATRERVHMQLDAWLERQTTAQAALEALQAQHPTYWAKITAARASGKPGTDAKAYAAHPTYAALLDAERAYTALQAERARLERALEELSRI